MQLIQLMQRIFIFMWLLVFVYVVMVDTGSVLAATQPFSTQTNAVASAASSLGTVVLPDWEELSLSDLSPILTGGSIGNQWNETVGYDLARIWSPGEHPEDILKLGDLAESFAAQRFTLREIRNRTGIDLGTVALSQFPLLGEQTLAGLVEVIPRLGILPVQEILPIALLLKEEGIQIKARSLRDILVQDTFVADLQLNQIDLSSFSMATIPELESTVLQDFQNWQSQLVAQVPGLSQVPLGQMPSPITLMGNAVARIDLIWGATEGQRTRTISGSYKEGFAVPCEDSCAHLELHNPENSNAEEDGQLMGRQWISGQYQSVVGGSGCLQFLNGGREPTGRHPFGEVFKVVVWETDETTDTAETALFFRLSSFCGDSPYFLGPFPFLNYQRDDLILLGVVDGTVDNTSEITADLSQPLSSQPSAAANSHSSLSESLPFIPSSRKPNTRPCTSAVFDGISLDGLVTALSRLHGNSRNYQAVGEYVCVQGGGSCGRGIGANQTMSYTSQFQKQVQENPGGREWLDQIQQGYAPIEAEIMQFYPPQVQDQALQNAIAPLISQTQQELDPHTGRFFTGDRLLERVTQKWLGGSSSKVDSDYRDSQEHLTLHEYGVQVRQLYNATGGNPTCP